jgi:hypothetical protein
MLFLISSVKSKLPSETFTNQSWSNVYYPTSDECLLNGYNLYRSVDCNVNITACPLTTTYSPISGQFPVDECLCGYTYNKWYPNSTSQCYNSSRGCSSATCIWYIQYPQVANCGYSTSNIFYIGGSWSSPCISRNDYPSAFYKNFTCSPYPTYWNGTYNCNADNDVSPPNNISNANCFIGLDKSLWLWQNGNLNETMSGNWNLSGSGSFSIESNAYNLSNILKQNYTIIGYTIRLYAIANGMTYYYLKLYYPNGSVYKVVSSTFNVGGPYENTTRGYITLDNLSQEQYQGLYIKASVGATTVGGTCIILFPISHVRLWFMYPTVSCNIFKSSDYSCQSTSHDTLPVNTTINISSLNINSFYYSYNTPIRPTSCVENIYYNATNPTCYATQTCSGCYQCGTQYVGYKYDYFSILDYKIKAVDTNGNGIKNVAYKIYLLNKTSNTYYELENNPIQNSTCYNAILGDEQRYDCSKNSYTDVNGYAEGHILNITSQNSVNNLTYVIRMTYLNETHELRMKDGCYPETDLNSTNPYYPYMVYGIYWETENEGSCSHIKFNSTLIGNCTSNANCSEPFCYSDYCIAYNGICNAGVCTNYQTTCRADWGKCIADRFECNDYCWKSEATGKSYMYVGGTWNESRKSCSWFMTIDCPYGCSPDNKSCACLENEVKCLDFQNLYVCKNQNWELKEICPLGCTPSQNTCNVGDWKKCGRPCYKNGWNSSLEDTSEVVLECDYDEYCIWNAIGFNTTTKSPIYAPSCFKGYPCDNLINAELGIGYCGCNSTSLCKVVNGTKVCEDYSGRYYQGKYIGVDYWKSMLEGLGSFGIFFSSLFILSLIAIILSAMVSYYSHSIPLGLSSLLVIMLCYFTLLPDLYPRWISLIIILAIALYLAKIISEQVRR